MIKAKATVRGAISIVNAIALGKGAALGLDLKCEAYVELSKGKGEIVVEIEKEPLEDKNLVKEIVRRTLKNFGDKDYSVYVKTSSEIPIAKGLKSSSAISNAVSLALHGALYDKFNDFDVINLGVDASISYGVSITGAYDDACASYFGGLVITDNYERKLIKREALDELDVVILVPERKRYTKSVEKEIKAIKFLVEEAFNLSLKGEYFKAMTLNGLIYSMALQESTAPVYEALKFGALGAGLSGKGPAIAALCRAEDTKEIVDSFKKYGNNVIITKVNNRKAEVIRE
ncbi:MAG: shikimate kinase [Nitrososphaerales archaeon]